MWFFKSKSLNDVLNESKKVKVQGVIFHIRKLGPIDYVSGAKTLLQTFEIYKTKEDDALYTSEASIKKVKAHVKDVLMAGIIKPKLSRDKNCGEAIFIDDVLDNWDIANELYNKIINLTYGKKKTSFSFPGKS